MTPPRHPKHPQAAALYASTRASSRPLRELSTTWGELRGLLTTWWAAPAKDEAPCWSPHRLSSPVRRLEAVEAVSALVLDYDHLTPGESPWRAWEGLEGVAYTTWSSTPEAPRWRLVLPLASEVAGDLWRAVYGLALERAPDADPACCDPTRLHLAPVVGPAGHRELDVRSGRLVDLSEEVELVTADRAREAARAEARRLGAAARRAAARRRGQDVAPLLLREDPATRRAAGLEAGGRLVGEMVRRARCPSCGRRSVWYALKGGAARCDHVGSCSWSGPVSDL